MQPTTIDRLKQATVSQHLSLVPRTGLYSITLLAVVLLAAALRVGPISEQTSEAAAGDPNAGVEESDRTYAEAFAARLAFEPGTNSIVFTVSGQYPHGPALFRIGADPVVGRLAPTATVLSGLPMDMTRFTDVWSSPEAGNYLLGATSVDSMGHFPNLDTELYAMSGDASELASLTNGAHDIVFQALAQGGTHAFALNTRGELIAFDMDSGTVAILATDLFNAAGQPSARFAVSPDGGTLAVATLPEYDVHRLSVVQRETGAWLDLVETHGIDGDVYVSWPEFAEDGGTVFYAVSRRGAQATGEDEHYDSVLYAVEPTPGAMPVRLADLTALVGANGERLTSLHRGPDGNRLFFAYANRLYSFDIAGRTLSPLTPPDERVIGEPVTTSTTHGNWLAYVVEESLEPLTEYTARTGDPLDIGRFVRLIALP